MTEVSTVASAAGEEVGRNLSRVVMGGPAESDKRGVGRRAMRKTERGSSKGRRKRAKKGAPSEDGALRKWWQTDEGGGNAVCHLDQGRGRRFGL